MLFLRLLKESVLFALNAIKVNKLRTVLSLLGITIGIFAIISVFTVVDSMERNIRESIESLGDDVIFVQKWPWEFSADYPWWKYLNRPVPDLKEKNIIQKKGLGVEEAVFMISTNKTIEYRNRSIENADFIAVSENYEKVRDFELKKGRYFSEFEALNGKNTAVIGHNIAEKLFYNLDPIDKEIKIFGRKVSVIGVFNEEGEDEFGNSMDDAALLPVAYAKTFVDIDNERYNPVIMVKAQKNVSNAQLKYELRGLMRSVRRLRPADEDNFALNESSLISQGFDELFRIISLAGWIIGGFSILVGGFGIANIMFVSVKERTFIIGIQKALGAKRYFILLQFLFEAIILCIIGGGAGLILVMAGAAIASNSTDMTLVLTEYNILRGIFISVMIGLVSGIIPAMSASRLDPVVAIRSA